MNEYDLAGVTEVPPLDLVVGLAEQGTDFTITRDGEPRAVLVGWDRWRELMADLGEHARVAK